MEKASNSRCAFGSPRINSLLRSEDFAFSKGGRGLFPRCIRADTDLVREGVDCTPKTDCGFSNTKTVVFWKGSNAC